MATSKETINGNVYYFKYIELPRGIDGKRNRKKIRAKTVRELNDKINKFKEQLDSGYKAELDTNFYSFCKMWLEEVKFPKLRPTSREVYERILRIHVKPSPIAAIKVSEITVLQVQTWYNSLNYSNSLMQQIHKIIGGTLKYAFKCNLLQKDFSSVLEIPKQNVEPTKILTVEEYQRLVSVLDHNNLYDNIISIAIFTGARIGELSALTWGDLSGNVLTINKTFKYVRNLNNGKYEPLISMPKTAAGKRTIILPQKAIDLLEHHKLIQDELKDKLGDKYKHKELIFANQQGNYLAPHTIREHFAAKLDEANCSRVRFHSLRHLTATILLENKIDIKTVSSILGHANVEITQNIYQHVLDSLKEEASNVLNDVF